MKLNLTIDNNIASVFVKDEAIRDAGKMVDELVKAKVDGGTLEYNGITVDASKLQAITIEF